MSKRANQDAIIAASRANDLDAINQLLYPPNPQHAADVNHIDEHGVFPLSAVASKPPSSATAADLATLEYLLERGARVDLKGANNQTALFNAATKGSDRAVEVLVQVIR